MTDNNAAHPSTQALRDGNGGRSTDTIDERPVPIHAPPSTLLPDEQGGVARVLNAAPRSPKELVVSLMTTATLSGKQICDVLADFGGILCSHDLSTLEGVQVGTRLLGKGDIRLSDLGHGELLHCDSWLLAAVNTVKPDGEVNDFLSVTLGCGERIVRFASRWARVTLGMAMQYFIGRDWQPIVLMVNKSPLVVGQMITLQFQGLVNPPTSEVSNGQSRPSKKVRA